MTDLLFRPTPAWFDQSKLGIFIHWTASAIPGYAPVPQSRVLADEGADAFDAEAFDAEAINFATDDPTWRSMPEAEMYHYYLRQPDSAVARYHAEHYRDLPFDAFVDKFRATMIPGWDPVAWADLFAQAGAWYVVFCSKVEDGFLMWPSAHPNPHQQRWQSDRDVVGELAAAVRERGMRFGVYYSGGWDFTFGGADARSFSQMAPTENGYGRYVEAHWHELIERYRPEVLWNDYGTTPADVDLPALFRRYFAQVPEGVVNDRFDWSRQPTVWAPGQGDDLPADFVTPEQSSKAPAEGKWEACWPLGHGFGYNREETDHDYVDPGDLIHRFVDIVARGGNLLLNVGPTGAGQIPWLQAQRLVALGHWLRANGEAIYRTRPWDKAAGVNDEGIRTRYTCTDDSVYALVLGTPRTASVELDVQLAEGARVELLGWGGSLPWRSTSHGTLVALPDRPDRRPAMSLRLSPRAAVSAQ